MTRIAHVDELELIVDDHIEPEGGIALGAVLRAVDVGAAVLSALIVLGISVLFGPLVVDVASLLLLVSVPLLAIGTATGLGLYQRRKCAIASVEISRIGRASVASGLGLLLILQAADSRAPYTTAIGVGAVLFLLMTVGRSWYRHWLKQARLEGRFLTPVAIVGDTMTAQRFAERLRANLDGGYAPVAHIDTEREPGGGWSPPVVPRVAHVDDDLHTLLDAGVRSAVVLTPQLSANDLNRTVRSMRERFDHVHVVTSLAGVAHSRLVPTPLIDETSFYLEPVVASTWQRAVKRATDIAFAALLLVLVAPIVLVAAIAIKLTDGGPVMYAQERVGRNGTIIRIKKMRSMVVDADERLAEIAEESNDRDGPLFKSSVDPRITAVGRILRATSIDELPQLWSILRGDMSLVGPRPALPAEVVDFDDAHRRRHEVRPGLTGLWQVQDRDHPDFERYRRHDVFYIENWSLSLDIAIMLQTAAAVLRRAVRMVTGSNSDPGVGA